jgi:hypothetical protein
MIDELVEVSGKSGPHVVWRPGTNGELVVAARLEAFRSRSPIKMSRGGTPQAISSESLLKGISRHHEMTDGVFIKLASVNAEPTSSLRFVAVTLLQSLGSSQPDRSPERIPNLKVSRF